MGIDEVGYNRKDIETNLGYIFNVPDDYELNESSDNHLFGIIEIPFDAFSKEESIKGSGRGRSGGSRGRGNQNPCQKALYSLITILLGRGPGGFTRQQLDLRDYIKSEITDEIRRQLGDTDIAINLKVSSINQNGGLFIDFSSSSIAHPGKFHLTIHDRFFNNPTTHSSSMAHSEGDGRHSQSTLVSVQTLLKLACRNNGPNEIKFLLSLRDQLDASATCVSMVNIAISVLNDTLFDKTMYRRESSSPWTTVVQASVDTSDPDAFPSLRGGRRVKYKKTKRAKKTKKTKKARKTRKTKKAKKTKGKTRK